MMNAQPVGARSLDHFVDAVHDVDAAALCYQKLGFHVLPKMRHLEIGSCNRIVQLEGTYLELVGDIDRCPPALRDRLLPRLQCGEGMTMTSLTSSDLPGDHRQLSATPGLNVDRILNARRPVTMPDGSIEETNSHCFYVWNPISTFLTLFLAEHYKPHTIWIPEYMRHPNGARRVVGQTFVARAPLDQLNYFASLLGSTARVATPDCVQFVTPRGELVEILSRERLQRRFQEAAPADCEHFLGFGVALRYEVADISLSQRILAANDVPYIRNGDVLTVAATHAAGIVTEFAQAPATAWP